ncbi:unnamed protein product [Durusdinium trenchii]|uniref:RING-type domain-containing protein n=1 Tax=Durusdinium trenchii TaxID=1381693 RepID=A0ABP0RSC1_9DINO
MTTPPPLRLVMKSYDKLSQISMKVTWIDEDGEEQNWSSWDDALCGRCGATKVLPAQSRDIQVRFRVQPGGRKVQQVDRKNRCAWTRAGEEVIHLRSYGDDSKGIDAWFELRGPMTHCHVWRAWNACNTGAPDPWEHWPDFPSDRAAPPPATLQAADTAAPWPGNQASPKGEDYTVRVTGAMSRLVAAAEVLLAVRRRTSRALEELDNQLTKQWFRVNSGNTVAAGLAVASFGSLFVAPPIGVALGATSAAAGVSSGAGDVVADAEKGRNLAKLMEVDITEELAFDSIESELRCALAKAVQRQRGASRGGAAATTALAAYAQTANLVLLRSAKYIALSQAGAESLALAGRLLGGLGAGLAVGVAAHGWSTTKPMQKLVKEKLIEIERSMEYLEGLRQQMSGALRCPLCDEPLGFGARELRRCSRFHCFHAHCVQEGCPECEEPVARVKSTDQLGALLWLAGIRDFCALTLDSLAPQLNHARDLVQRLTTSEDVGLIMQRRVDDEDAENDSPKSSGSPKRSDEAPEEVAEAHEAWQLAMEETHLLDGTCLAKVAVEKLLLGERADQCRCTAHKAQLGGRPPCCTSACAARCGCCEARGGLRTGDEPTGCGVFEAWLRGGEGCSYDGCHHEGFATGMSSPRLAWPLQRHRGSRHSHTELSTSPCYGFRDRRDSGDMVHCGLLLNPWLQRNIVAIYCWAVGSLLSLGSTCIVQRVLGNVGPLLRDSQN